MAPGLGEATGHLSEGLQTLEAALGAILPGTLNVLLDRPFEAPPSAHGIQIPRLPWRDMPFYFFPAMLESRQAVWIVRSLSQLEQTDDLLELVASVHLRTVLNLHDGDAVTIALREESGLDPLSPSALTPRGGNAAPAKPRAESDGTGG